MMFKILVCDPIHEKGIAMLRQQGYDIDVKPQITSDELKDVVSHYDALIVRSRTKVTEDIINKGKKLKAIGRSGVGLDNINLQAAKAKSIKAPLSKTAQRI